MCEDPLVTMFAILGVGFVVITLMELACDGIIAVLDWWCPDDC
jgi:hypothetical protein